MSPGTSPGRLTVNGNATFNAGSTFFVELNGTTVATQYDQLTVNGAVNLGGATLTGTVGAGFADGAVVGNVFTSPSAAEAASVSRAVHSGAGVVLITGNYAGDVLNFGLAVERLGAEGITARFVAVTDDVASAGPGEVAKRRGIAGDFPVFKAAAAAADEGADLDGVVHDDDGGRAHRWRRYPSDRRR